MKVNAQPPRSVPVLTEVVVMPKAARVPDSEFPAMVSDSGFPATQPALHPSTPAIQTIRRLLHPPFAELTLHVRHV